MRCEKDTLFPYVRQGACLTTNVDSISLRFGDHAMGMFRLTASQAAFVQRLWELSPPGAKYPAIGINLEEGFRSKYHDTQEDAPPLPGFYNLRTADNPKPGPLTVVEVALGATIINEMICKGGPPPTHVAGIPNAGTPFGQALANMLGLPHLELVKGEKNGKRAIVGIRDCPVFGSKIQSRVLIVDDVLSEADTKLEVLNLDCWGEASVSLALLVDRQQGGREALRGSRMRSLYTAMTTTQVMCFSHRMRKITRAERDAVLAYPTILDDFKRGLSSS